MEWYAVNNIESNVEQDFFTLTFNGNKASIYAKKPGEATVYCQLKNEPSIIASCKVSGFSALAIALEHPDAEEPALIML